jgi:hypothetical protein
MLTDLVLGCDGKHPQPMDFEGLFNYQGKKNLKKMKSLRAVAETTPMSLAYLGDLFPGLQILRLDHSIISSVRDIGTQLPLLRVFTLDHCGLVSLNGICAICPRVEELSAAFNEIDDTTDLLGLNSLRHLNIESNQIASVDGVGLLKCCRKFRSLVLRGNPADQTPDYRDEVKRLLPRLRVLDDVAFDDPPEDPEPAAAQEAPAPAEEPRDPDLPKTAPIVLRPLGPITPIPYQPGGTENRVATASVSHTMVPSKKIARPVVKAWHNIGSIRL